MTVTRPAGWYQRLASEAEFQASVVEFAETAGWWVWHDRDSRGNLAGLPDLILVRPPRVMFIELKKESGRVSAVQRAVLRMFDQCPGVETCLWRPSDWPEIARSLQSPGRRP